MCVGIGVVLDNEEAEEALDQWQSRSKGRSKGKGRPKRVVVKMTDVFKPAAYCAHYGAPHAPSGRGRATMEDVGKDGLVLWDIAHLRLSSDWKEPPAASASSANGTGSGSYDDDDTSFLSAPPPPRVVYASGRVSPCLS